MTIKNIRIDAGSTKSDMGGPPCLAQQGPVSQRRDTRRPVVPGITRQQERAAASRCFATFAIPLVARMTISLCRQRPLRHPAAGRDIARTHETQRPGPYSHRHVSDPCEQGDWRREAPVTKASLFRKKKRCSMLTLTRISRKTGGARRGGRGRGGRLEVPSLTLPASLQNSSSLTFGD